MIRRWAPRGEAVFAAWYLITNPTGAATAVNHAATHLSDWGRSLSVFVNNLGG
jgi:hypothetical protein